MIQTRSVKDLMNADIMTIADDMTTDEAARYLIEHEIQEHRSWTSKGTSSVCCR